MLPFVGTQFQEKPDNQEYTEHSKRTVMGTYSYRNIWKVAYPILISLVMEQMIGLTDTAFLGRVGEVELGASGTGSTKTAFRLELVALAVYMVYCTVLIGWIKADVAVCWTAEHVYAGMLLLTSWIYMRSGSWKNHQI